MPTGPPFFFAGVDDDERTSWRAHELGHALESARALFSKAKRRLDIELLESKWERVGRAGKAASSKAPSCMTILISIGLG